MVTNFIKRFTPIGLLLFVSTFSVLPLLSRGYFPMHDDTQVGRTVVMGRALLNGQFPVRWVSDLGYGYGYPIFSFYGPLPYYVSGGLYAVGLDGLTSTKFMMIAAMILAPLSFYLSFNRLIGRSAAVLGAVLYLFSPYHAVELYVRGAIGEMWVLVFLPLIVAPLISFFASERKTTLLLMSTIGIAGAILSHTILGFTTIIFYLFAVGVVYLWEVWKKYSHSISLRMIGIVVLGLGLTAFFWFPAVAEMKYTSVAGQVGPSADFRDHFVCPQQFFSSPWGFGGSTAGCSDGMSFALGKIHIFLAVIGFAILFLRRNNSARRIVGIIGAIITIGFLFMMIDASQFVWNILPGFSYIQYPWRFLVYTTLGLSLIGMYVISFLRQTLLRIGLVLFLIIIIIIGYSKLFAPQYLYLQDTARFESDEELRFRVSKISDEYLPPEIPHPTDIYQVPSRTIPLLQVHTIKPVIDRETYKKFEFVGSQIEKITLNHAHFPGWQYKVNGSMQPVELSRGRPIITLPEGFSTLEMIFSDTPIRRVGNVISLFVMLVLVIFYGKKTIN